MSHAPHSATVDRYLQAIYCIQGEGEVARPGRLAYWLEVSAPTVSDALQRMQRDGWLTIAKDRSVTLTKAGQDLATKVIWKHRVLERWLTDVLGFNWADADEEAEQIALAMSDAVVERIDQSMNSPATCPHGNVIPGRTSPYGDLCSLADVSDGEEVTVRRISEVAEHEARVLLSSLAEHDIKEGTALRVVDASDESGSVSVLVKDMKVTLTHEAVSVMWVETN